MKLNVGCGTDYREGFINIDGSSSLPKVDKVIDISVDSLASHFKAEEVEFILANDIIEHHFHWEAVRIMTDFYNLLQKGGKAEIRVPDASYIIKSWRYPMERKLIMLFGGQDIPRGKNAEQDKSRAQFPQYFCHKYGWTQKQMELELLKIGFSKVICKRERSNFIAYATK